MKKQSGYTALAMCMALLAAGMIGCGGGDDKDDKKDKDNKAAKKTNMELLVGSWELDLDATLEAAKGEAKTDEEKKGIDATGKMMAQMKMKMEFTADGKAIRTMTMGGQEQKDEQKYTAEDKGDHLLVNVEGDLGEAVVKFESDDKVRVEPTREQQGPRMMIFNRSK